MRIKQGDQIPTLISVTATAVILGVHTWMLYTGWMMANGRIPPNPYVGNRTERTLADPEIWYQVNALAGKIILIASAVAIPFAIVFAIAIFNKRVRQKLRIGQAEALGLLAITLLVYVAALFAQ